LINREKILLPPLHIKLRLMKQFVKALDRDGACFKYLTQLFSKLSNAKIKESIFVGSQIRKLMKSTKFETVLTPIEKKAWIGFKNVV